MYTTFKKNKCNDIKMSYGVTINLTLIKKNNIFPYTLGTYMKMHVIHY